MQSGTIMSGGISGVEAHKVQVCATVTDGLPSVVFVGSLSEPAVRECRVRVQSAIANSGFVFPVGRVTIEVKAIDEKGWPSGRKVDGTALDLPVALAILMASGQIPQREETGSLVVFGELGLSGDVRPVRGAVVLAKLRCGVAADRIARGLSGHLSGADVLCPYENGAEAALNARALSVNTLREAATVLATGTGGEGWTSPTFALSRETTTGVVPDMRDIRGSKLARRAMEIAAAGGHSVMLTGGPGAGKTMLARRLPGILPLMTEAEAREVTEVHSVAGLNVGGGLVKSRPFRAPHHSTTAPGLVGGGSSVPRPGELSLAHRGVLFLDETPEFSRMTLEVLREPIETGSVVLSRASGTLRYPSEAMIVASQNPCPCGSFGNPKRPCRCTQEQRTRYLARSEPIARVCDIRIEVEPVDLAAIESEPVGEDSATIRARAVAAHERRNAREAATVLPDVTEGGRALLATYALGVADAGRVLRVARTIADLAGLDVITDLCLSEALQITK